MKSHSVIERGVGRSFSASLRLRRYQDKTWWIHEQGQQRDIA